MADAAIVAEELVKTYRGGVRALDGLSFRADAGAVFALLGPNGAGKSTTVKSLTTLSRPDSGRALVAGVDVLADPARVRRRIGVVAQKHGIDLEATGRENLALQASVFGLRGAERRVRVQELLDTFALADAADRLARTYSGGMQRKLDIAMGLVHRPEVLFLDEPTTGLDPEARADLWTEIERLTADGLTILLTTHYLDEADRLARSVAIVDHGRVVAEGSPDALKAGLRGDAIHVELAAPADERVTQAVGGLDGLIELRVDGPRIDARAESAAAALPGVLAAIEGAGVAVRAATIARPSLDDVYLHHVGRRFDEDGEGR